MTTTTYHEVSPKEFISQLAKVPASLSPFLSNYSIEDYEDEDATCYLSNDAQSGYAITGDLDLVSVFSLPNAKQGKAAVFNAIENGARTLDCTGDHLADLYKQCGWQEVSRVKWDNKYAPDSWDYLKFGTPDIIYMKIFCPANFFLEIF